VNQRQFVPEEVIFAQELFVRWEWEFIPGEFIFAQGLLSEEGNKQCFSLFACWFQPGLISQSTVFFSHNKPAPARLISPETNHQT